MAANGYDEPPSANKAILTGRRQVTSAFRSPAIVCVRTAKVLAIPTTLSYVAISARLLTLYMKGPLKGITKLPLGNVRVPPSPSVDTLNDFCTQRTPLPNCRT